jgi:hypothetical protein
MDSRSYGTYPVAGVVADRRRLLQHSEVEGILITLSLESKYVICLLASLLL